MTASNHAGSTSQTSDAFTVSQRGHIIVDKVTDPAGSTQSFEFDPSYGLTST